MHLALFEPDIPQNTGTLIRLGACFSVSIDIIEPCGFVFSDRRLKRAGMDYFELADVTRHESWSAFLEAMGDKRLVLLTTKGSEPYTGFTFREDDVLILGRESAGVTEEVHARADARLRIPIRGRSLNVAISGAIVLAEALRQTDGFPAE